MAAYEPPVDIEALVIKLLKNDLDQHDLTRGRISTELPSDFKAEPRIRIEREGGTTTESMAKRLDRATLRGSFYGSTKSEAFEVSRLFHTALEKCIGDHGDSVITHTEILIQPYWSREQDTNIPRYFSLFVVNVHPQR